jgi:Helix-turn-helix domain
LTARTSKTIYQIFLLQKVVKCIMILKNGEGDSEKERRIGMVAKESTNFDDEYVKTGAAASFIKHSPNYLQNLRYFKKGPPYIRRGRSIFYSKRDLREWMESGRICPED